MSEGELLPSVSGLLGRGWGEGRLRPADRPDRLGFEVVLDWFGLIGSGGQRCEIRVQWLRTPPTRLTAPTSAAATWYPASCRRGTRGFTRGGKTRDSPLRRGCRDLSRVNFEL